MVSAYFLLLALLLNPEDGGITFLRNVDKHLPDYPASYHRRYYE
jgi:hypothetical protein